MVGSVECAASLVRLETRAIDEIDTLVSADDGAFLVGLAHLILGADDSEADMVQQLLLDRATQSRGARDRLGARIRSLARSRDADVRRCAPVLEAMLAIADDCPAPSASSPAGPRNRAAILAATWDLLGETGYQRLRLDDVAASSKASKATIYRHWRTKADLVRDAVVEARATLPVAASFDTGTLRDDLATWIESLAERMLSGSGRALVGLLTAMATDTEVEAKIRPLVRVDLAPVEGMLQRAMDRGEVPPVDLRLNAETLVETALGVLVLHHHVRGLALDKTFLDHIIDDVLVPAAVHAA